MSDSLVSKPADPSDESLSEGCRRHSLAAYQRLFETHGGRMKSLAYNILGNTADAEDAVQEAFLKIFRNVDSFKGDAAFSTWVFRILVNSCRDIQRRSRRRRAEVRDSDSSDEMNALPEPTAADHPLRISLEQSLRKLDARSRTVFLLYEVEGFKHREIAEVLNIPEGTSKNLLFHAKRELQVLLSRAGRIGRA